VDPVEIGHRAINYLTRIGPKEEGYVPFFGGKVPWHGVPYLVHCPWDYGDGIGRILEALAFVRRMTGSDHGMDVQEGLTKKLCRLYAPDGITYREAAPWSTPVSGPYEMRSSLLALIALLENGDESLEGLIALAVDGIARAFSPELLPTASGVWDGEKWTGEKWIGVEIGAGLPMIDPLIRCHCAIGSDKALQVASAIVEHYFFGPEALFGADGSFIFPGDECPTSELAPQTIDYVPSLGHFHTRTCAAVGLARYGIVANDETCVDLARRIHDRMLPYGTSFGWFPENLFTDGREVSELCATLDMIELELLLARAGQTELYDAVERFLRNHVAVSQFVPDELVRQYSAEAPEGMFDKTGQKSYDDVLSRLSGGFVCVSYPDDLYTAYPRSRFDPKASYLIDISACCSGSGAKAAYVAWRDAVIEDDDAVRVNLAIPRRHPSVDVLREEDGVARVTLRCRADKPVLFRIPDWVSGESVRITVNSEPALADIVDGYIQFGPDCFGSGTVELELPLTEREEQCEVAGISYGVRWCGDQVCDVYSEDGRVPRRNPYRDWFGCRHLAAAKTGK